jgi:hypothetical protein
MESLRLCLGAWVRSMVPVADHLRRIMVTMVTMGGDLQPGCLADLMTHKIHALEHNHVQMGSAQCLVSSISTGKCHAKGSGVQLNCSSEQRHSKCDSSV